MRTCLFVVLLLLACCVNAQKAPFSLTGKVDMANGTIVLIPAHDSLLYPKEHYHYETQVKNGAFSFNGNIEYPLPMILAIKDGDKLRYRTTWFYLDKGNQQAEWRTNNTQSTDAHVSNVAMTERQRYEASFSEVNSYLHDLAVAINGMEHNEANAKTKADLQQRYDEQAEKKYAMIQEYASNHPGSFLPLWDAVRMLDKGYLPLFDQLPKVLSPDVRNSVTGKEFTSAVEKLKLTLKGGQLPSFTVTNADGKDTTINTSQLSDRYTLVDFWYSNCYPCLRLFPEFKKLYDAYHHKGFEIIAVSIDEGKYVDAWKKVITEKGLDWPQFLDKNRQTVQALHILRFPTSFLLDEHGMILQQDIRPEELETLLKADLH